MSHPERIEFPAGLAEAEAASLVERRKAWAAGASTDPSFAEGLEKRHQADGCVGLALSGGGIRSATFSLGFVQALARAKLLRHVDYLSTVSGGSYFGGFLGAFYNRLLSQGKTGTSEGAPLSDPARIETELSSPRSSAVDWLRENGRYLAPGGAADGWMALAVILRNMIAVNAVSWTMILTTFVGMDLVRAGAAFCWSKPKILWFGGAVWWSPYVMVPVAVLVGALVPIGLAYWLVPDDGTGPNDGRSLWFRRWRTTLLSAVVVPLGGLLALVFLPPRSISNLRFIFDPTHGHWPVVAGAGVGLASMGWGWLGGARWAIRRENDGREPYEQLLRAKLSRWLRAWLILFSGLLLIAVVDSLGQTVYRCLPGIFRHLTAGSLVAAVSGLAAAASAVQKAIGALGSRAKIGVPLRLVALLGAIILVTPILVGLSALGHEVVWQGAPPQGTAPTPACGPAKPLACEVDATGTVRLTAPSGPTPAEVWGAPPIACWWWPLTALLVGVGLCLAFGNTYSFLNDSSISGLYAARLTRAYVGASNPSRATSNPVRTKNAAIPATVDQRENGVKTPATDILSDDVIPLRAYQPHAAGGPLHIINTTLNETIGGRSRVEEKDRKGMNLAIGPGGVSVGVQHHATWIDSKKKLVSTDETVRMGEFRVFPAFRRKDLPRDLSNAPDKPANVKRATFSPESLALGDWMAISGAAASTALGSMTSLGLSLLCGLLNVRLGHWWTSDVNPRDRPTAARPNQLQKFESRLSRLFPVQAHLFQELAARFRGTDSRGWYLTDGGHFENTGAYELIRRRLKTIILVDNGADPERHLSDLANLVRKARVDFDARIEFVDPSGKDDKGLLLHPQLVNLQDVVGTLAELGFGPGASGATGVRKYAALARVTYGSDAVPPRGWLLLVKPALKDDDSEPVDVREYKRTNPDFPQQTTADQFFDEAQWEAYRKLGEHIGNHLFQAGGSAGLASALKIV